MYYRLKNEFEVDLFKNDLQRRNIPSIIIDRMSEIANVLDSDYGINRSSTAYGGYILFFPTTEDYKAMSPIVLQNYHVEPELSEYDDCLCTSSVVEWHEVLYLLSSEDSLVFIFPTVKEKKS